MFFIMKFQVIFSYCQHNKFKISFLKTKLDQFYTSVVSHKQVTALMSGCTCKLFKSYTLLSTTSLSFERQMPSNQLNYKNYLGI